MTRTRLLGALKVAAGVLILPIGIQFVRPELSNPPVRADLSLPPAVKSLFVTACYDCHSNETELAWFDHIVPAYWLVVHDVREARARLNFSELGGLPVPKQRALLYDAVNKVELGAMPPRAYRSLHPRSDVFLERIDEVKRYLEATESPAPSAPAQLEAADAQYQAWLNRGPATGSVRPSPNGIAYLPDYMNWQVLSVTQRFDDHMLRAVLGNEVAARAVAENRIDPWPDGSALAKVAWSEILDVDENIRAGEFKQVAFMLKDATKYAATQGWGYAIWRGTELEPGGKDASFTNECVDCHEPMRARDFVFTVPLTPTPVPPGWRLITSAIDARRAEMSVLYGNDIAVEHARRSNGDYPPGAELSLVVWQQRADPNWYGARIPGNLQSVDALTVGASGAVVTSGSVAPAPPLSAARASVLP